MRRISTIVLVAIAAAALVGVWEAASRGSNTVRLWISAPSTLGRYFLTEWPALKMALLYTSGEALAGLLVALAAGTGTAVFFARRFEFPASVRAFVDAASVVPLLVIGPFITLIVPVGFATAVVVTALVCFFAYTRLLVDAFSRTPASLRDIVRLYRIPPGRMIRHILLPYHLRAVLGAVRATMPLAITGAVVAEMFGTRHGLGRNIFEASIRLNPELFICSTFLIVCLGVSLNYLVVLCERLKVKG